MVKNTPAMQETWVRSLGQEDPLEKGKAIHSSILAWRIPQTEELGALHSPWGCKEFGQDLATEHAHTFNKEQTILHLSLAKKEKKAVSMKASTAVFQKVACFPYDGNKLSYCP